MLPLGKENVQINFRWPYSGSAKISIVLGQCETNQKDRQEQEALQHRFTEQTLISKEEKSPYQPICSVLVSLPFQLQGYDEQNSQGK